ncbi:MAG: type II toxin-antitoxin system VapC family toxin [Candidatus Omnitrophica bacterium]|nr:type II toxin-antitoxin system VapC family toxin [Candidatus Omnitrophota bacterium]
MRVFADTFYFLALTSKKDKAHARALEYSEVAGLATLTTAWVLAELANALADPPLRDSFARLLARIMNNPNCTVVPASGDLFDRGMDLYLSRRDKSWSLTDCISFLVMEELDVHEALTGDRHFEQAGFTALLK